jgi:hypothetical protein
MAGAPIAGPAVYGKRKMSPEQYAAQAKKKARTTEGRVYGSRKGGPKGEAEPAAPANPFLAKADENQNGRVTLKELEAQLRAAPELLDTAIEAEYADGSPRVGAVKLFTELEQARAGGPRADVLSILGAAAPDPDDETETETETETDG